MVHPPSGTARPRPGPGAGLSAGAAVGAVVTPDAVRLDLETATVGTRALAALIDLTIVVTGLLLIAVAEGILGVSGFVPGWLGLALLLVLAFALQFGYPIGFETLTRGRTPGKMALGLRVVTVEGAPIGLRHATIRALLGVVELLGTLGAGAVVTSLVTARGQRLGDLAAGTLVVRERSGRERATAERFVPPPGTEAYTATLDVSRLSAADYATLRETLRRLGSLPPAAGARVAAEIAAGLQSRVRPIPPPSMPPAVWLRCAAAAVQARRPGGPGTVAPAQAPSGLPTPTGPPPASPPLPPSGPAPPSASDPGGSGFVAPG